MVSRIIESIANTSCHLMLVHMAVVAAITKCVAYPHVMPSVLCLLQLLCKSVWGIDALTQRLPLRRVNRSINLLNTRTGNGIAEPGVIECCWFLGSVLFYHLNTSLRPTAKKCVGYRPFVRKPTPELLSVMRNTVHISHLCEEALSHALKDDRRKPLPSRPCPSSLCRQPHGKKFCPSFFPGFSICQS